MCKQCVRFTVSKFFTPNTARYVFDGIFGKWGNRESIGIVEKTIVYKTEKKS